MSTFLDSLNADLRKAIERIGVTVTLGARQKVFERGDTGESFYIIEKGSVIVHDGALVLNELAEGEAFGEIAGLGGMPRTATVTATEDLTLLRVEREALYSVLQTEPESLRYLVQMLCERESGMADRMTNRAWRLKATEHELEIGQRIQAGFLPDVLPDIPGYEVAGHFQAARVVAGDFYDAFTLSQKRRVTPRWGDS